MNNFKLLKNNLKLSNDWFTDNIPTWLRAFDKVNFYNKKEITCLEVGSWEGLSAFFLLNEFKNLKITCVDTWEGADEHKDGAFTTLKILANVENVFDHNLLRFKDRLLKFKGKSSLFYEKNFQKDYYDLIYVDGSHHAKDVLIDAENCYEMLKSNGLLIFDDYFWKYYKNDLDNPAGAINSLIRKKNKNIKIICFDYQLIILKL